MLEVRDLHAGYGELEVVHGVSFTLNEGQIGTIIGPNGAGKSTTLKAVMGLISPAAGSVALYGTELHKLSTESIVRMGVSYVPEGRRIFPGLSVRDNLVVAAAAGQASQRSFDDGLARVLHLFPRLSPLLSKRGWTLSGGEQQMLAIGRALIASPKLILLDEPSIGLAPRLVSDVFRSLTEIRSLDTTLLIVEQNAHEAMQIADVVWVLSNGTVARSGTAADLASDPELSRIYLGGV